MSYIYIIVRGPVIVRSHCKIEYTNCMVNKFLDRCSQHNDDGTMAQLIKDMNHNRRDLLEDGSL